MKTTVENFSLKHTLESGQFFNYDYEGDCYKLIQRSSRFTVKQNKNMLHYEGISKSELLRFLGINQDHKIMLNDLKDKNIQKAYRAYPGLRLMNQDPWQCLVSFVCSSASNIQKIRLNMKKLSETFGKKLGEGNYAFPEPGSMNDLQRIKDCATGFRAKYLFSINNTVTDKWLAELRNMPYEQAKDKLKGLYGVSDKIADCVLLFSLGFKQAFPVDVWIERAMKELYFENQKVNHDQIREFASQKFSNHAGLAQQYLYHWRRLGA